MTTLPMTTNDHQRLPMTTNDHQWLTMTTNDYQWLPMTTNDYQWLMFKSDGTFILRWSCYSPSSTAQPVGSFLVSIDFGRYATSWSRIDCRKGFQTCNCIILILDTIIEEKKVTFLQEPDLYEKKSKHWGKNSNFEMNISKIDYRKYFWTLSRDLFSVSIDYGRCRPMN